MAPQWAFKKVAHLLLAPADPASHGGDAQLEDEVVHGRQASAAGNSVDRPAEFRRKRA